MQRPSQWYTGPLHYSKEHDIFLCPYLCKMDVLVAENQVIQSHWVTADKRRRKKENANILLQSCYFLPILISIFFLKTLWFNLFWFFCLAQLLQSVHMVTLLAILWCYSQNLVVAAIRYSKPLTSIVFLWESQQASPKTLFPLQKNLRRHYCVQTCQTAGQYFPYNCSTQLQSSVCVLGPIYTPHLHVRLLFFTPWNAGHFITASMDLALQD